MLEGTDRNDLSPLVERDANADEAAQRIQECAGGAIFKPEYTRTMLNKLRRYSPEDVASLRAYPRRQHRSEIEASYMAQLPPQQVMKLFDRYCGARSA